jgi:hypothetical protein
MYKLIFIEPSGNMEILPFNSLQKAKELFNVLMLFCSVITITKNDKIIKEVIK